ncbi:MAG: hypothetical protein V3S54_07540 [Woeseiaceae bacterium]
MLPHEVEHWSLTTLREQLIKQGFLFFVSRLQTMQIIDDLLADWD